MKSFKKLMSFLMSVTIAVTSIAIAGRNVSASGSDEVVTDVGVITDAVEDEPEVVKVAPKVKASSGDDKSFWARMTDNYYYNQLTTAEKTLYNRLYDSAMNFMFSSDYGTYISASYADTGLSQSKMFDVARIFYRSNPQFFYLQSSYYIYPTTQSVIIYVYTEYANGSARAAGRSDVASKISEYIDIAASYSLPESKEYAVCMEMLDNISYAFEADSLPYQSINSALRGYTVCAGYAMLFSAVMNYSGVETTFVASSDHQWNVIKLHGYWYYIDVTNIDQPDYPYFPLYNTNNDNSLIPDIIDYLKPYAPNVIYDDLEYYYTNEYSTRYAYIDGVTYFIVSDKTEDGLFVVPVSGSTSSLPTQVTINGYVYDVSLASLGKSGWVKNNGVWYYYDYNGTVAKGWKKIDGSYYFFDDSGVMLENWQFIGDKWYFLENGKMIVGWKKLGNDWYYFKDSGCMATGWIQSNDYYYFFDEKGKMLTGWQQLGSDKYYFLSSGEMVTDWKNIGGAWYYFSGNGAVFKGWLEIFGVWYYMNSDGKMLTGWQEIEGYWYYFRADGPMVTGWLSGGGYWYYLNSDGTMSKGWKQINGVWYFFQSDGIMSTGWKQLGGTWYYFESNGSMVSGWKQIKGEWYFFMSSGSMVQGTTYNGYIFDENGVCQNP